MFTKKRQVRLPQVRRRAGESLRERREKILDEKLLPIVFVPFFFWLVYVVQQFQQWNHAGPQPQLWLCFAIVATVVSVIWFLRLRPTVRNINRGERGERHVADVLEELRVDGYKPIHDIVADRFNIDHVLVGPAGVFAIETKYRSGKGEITFRDTEGVSVGGRLEEKDCLKQARANATAIRDLIHESCGRREWVTPIVVFVGDWKIRNKWRDTHVRVFTPERLLDYIRDQQPQLTRSEIQLIASHLERSTKS
jgi:Nuclease-related domain